LGQMKLNQVAIPLRGVNLDGELCLSASGHGLVVFAHGSGSSRLSPRNQYVARVLNEGGLGTLLFDLLTIEEEQAERRTGNLRFDIAFLAQRLAGATRWVLDREEPRDIVMGFFGSSTGAAAALVAAAELGNTIKAVVSRGGRPDLAGSSLERVAAPTMLIVGSNDLSVVPLNESAYAQLHCQKELRLVPGASHLFKEPGALEQVAKAALDWFVHHLQPRSRAKP